MDTPESSKYNELNNAQVTNGRMNSCDPAPVTPDALIQPSFPENNNAYVPMEEVQKDIEKKTNNRKGEPDGLVYLLISILIGYNSIEFLFLFLIVNNIFLLTDAIISTFFALLLLFFTIRKLRYKNIFLILIYIVFVISIGPRFYGYTQVLDALNKKKRIAILVLFSIIDFIYSMFRILFDIFFCIFQSEQNSNNI